MASDATLNQLVIHAGLEAFDGEHAEDVSGKNMHVQNQPGMLSIGIAKLF